MSSQNPIIYLCSRLWNHAKGNKKQVVSYLVMTWVSNLAHLCIPLIFALLINELQKNGVTENNFFYLLFLSSLFIVRCIVTWSLHGPSRIMEAKNSFRNRANYKIHLLKGVLDMPLAWHAENHSGDTFDKIEKGANGISDFSENTFRVVGIVNSMTISSLVLAFFDPWAALIALVMIVITLSIIAAFDKRLAKNYRDLNKMENKISEKVMDVITNVNTVVILRIEKLLLKSIKEKIMAPFELFKKTNRTNEIKWFLVSFCCNSMIFLVIVYYLYRVSRGMPLAIGTFYALYGYTNNVGDNFFEFAGFYGDLLKYKARIMNAEELASKFKAESNVNGEIDRGGWKSLRANNINFSYHTEDNTYLHLENVEFMVGGGETIALVGDSGAGKTTLFKILRKLYEPQSARAVIEFEKETLERNGFGSISSQITLIPQDPGIFTSTIWENITMGVNYSPELVKKYVEMACFSEVVERLPKKFNSGINERGVNLSGGEKQRLALARGLLACDDKPIVFLDEPTSSIDTATERRIYNNIFSAFKDKAVVSSIHRLYLLPLFDTIYYLKDGKVIATGTLNELLTKCSEFNQLWREYHSHGQDFNS